MATTTKLEDHERCERLPLSTPTKRRLWAESGGYCQRPECLHFLFPDDGDIDFAEMAHIVAATTGGARDLPKRHLSGFDRAHHSNIAVLCANCHTVSDKDPDRYSVELMRTWKARHQEALRQVFGTPRSEARAAARAHVEPLLLENHTIFEIYCPVDDDYSTDRAHQWRTHAVRRLVPNNTKIARFLAMNGHLLTPEERVVAHRFSLHQEEFAARHVLGDYAAGTTRFPAGMDDVLQDDK